MIFSPDRTYELRRAWEVDVPMSSPKTRVLIKSGTRERVVPPKLETSRKPPGASPDKVSRQSTKP